MCINIFVSMVTQLWNNIYNNTYTSAKKWQWKGLSTLQCSVHSTRLQPQNIYGISQLLPHLVIWSIWRKLWQEVILLAGKVLIFLINSYSASDDNWYTATLWNRIMTAQCEGMGEVGSARYEPAVLPPCLSIRVLSYSNCQRSTHSSRRAWQCTGKC